MDSSATPPLPPPLEPPSKLPVKRKNPNPAAAADRRHLHLHDPPAPASSPPSKFHRIWSEPDEIRFLQCLLDCASSQSLSFPRDLRVFYRRFSSSSSSASTSAASASASQPYSNSQLYEKLRGLRKKYRAVSSRLDRGALDPSRLSPHDRALFDLSEKLWSPKYASASPFGTGDGIGGSNAGRDFASGSGDVMPDDGVGLVGVRVSFAAELHLGSKGRDENGRGMIGCAEEEDEEEEEEEGEENYVADGVHGNANGANAARGDRHGDLKMKEVNVGCDFGARGDGVAISNETSSSGGGGGIGELVKRAALDVFDQSLEEVKAGFSQEPLHCYCRCSCLADSLDSSFAASKDSPGRLLDQRSAELDVFGRRLRLIIEEVLTRK